MGLYIVDRDTFLHHVKRYKLKEIPGTWMHSSNFIDEKSEIKAFMETSSWGAPDVYQIDDPTFENLLSIQIIKGFMNR